MSECPCGNEIKYQECCEPFHLGRSLPPSPEAVMRSRYSAYVKGIEPYLRDTLLPESRKDYDAEAVKEWSKKSEWLGLEIQSANGNKVEFTAKYKTDGKILEHHEVSTFKKVGDRWFFVEGDSHVHEEGQGHHDHTPLVPMKRESEKVGRNDPCTCGSGKKFKKCCG